MITNTVTTAGVNQKLLPKYKGPYEISAVLPHDRYVVKDIEGFQLSNKPYEGILDPSHLKPYFCN